MNQDLQAIVQSVEHGEFGDDDVELARKVTQDYCAARDAAAFNDLAGNWRDYFKHILAHLGHTAASIVESELEAAGVKIPLNEVVDAANPLR